MFFQKLYKYRLLQIFGFLEKICYTIGFYTNSINFWWLRKKNNYKKMGEGRGYRRFNLPYWKKITPSITYHYHYLNCESLSRYHYTAECRQELHPVYRRIARVNWSVLFTSVSLGVSTVGYHRLALVKINRYVIRYNARISALTIFTFFLRGEA